jgi:hypothetical protein
MESGLTQFGIDELARQGVDVTGLAVGYPATDDMRRRLGIQDDVDPGALPDPVSAAQVAEGMATTLDPQAAALNAGSMDPAAVAGAMNAVPAAAAVTQEQLTAPKSGGLGDMLFGPQEATDQFSNLNRQQRMMLAFGAIKDAGFALQGKEGSAFSSTLKAINDQIDMGRKAQAAQAQQEALTSIMGPGEAAAGDIQAQIERLSRLAVANPNLAPGIAVRIKALQDAQKAQMGMEGKASSAAGQLETMQEIIKMIDNDPAMTTGPMAMFLRNVPFTQAGQTQALVDSLRSTLALDTLKDLKSTGATMGALNKEELNILLDDVTKLDLALGPDAVKKSLAKIDRRYKNIVRGLYRGASEDGMAQLDSHFKGRPAWLDPSSDAPAQGETDAEFLKRMREGRG